jgi:protein-S-isoprenylcysteine O-methyltransferase Ste14
MSDELTRRVFGGCIIYVATLIRFTFLYRTRKRSMQTVQHLPLARGAATISSWSWFALLAFAPFASWIPVDDMPVPAEWKSALAICGALLLITSVALFLACHVALGEFWNGEPGLRVGHELVLRGPYRWIRHPMYTSFFVGYLGALALLQSWVFLIPIVFAPGFHIMASVEEAILGRQFQKGYAAYRLVAGRFLPRAPALLRRSMPPEGT